MIRTLLIAGILSTLFARANMPVVDLYRAKAEAELELVFCVPAVKVEPKPVPPPKPQPKPDDKPKPKPGQIASDETNPVALPVVEPFRQVWMFTRPLCGDCQRNKKLLETDLAKAGWTVGDSGHVRLVDPKQSPQMVKQAELTEGEKLPISVVMVRQGGLFVRNKNTAIFHGYWGNAEIFESWAREVKR